MKSVKFIALMLLVVVAFGCFGNYRLSADAGYEDGLEMTEEEIADDIAYHNEVVAYLEENNTTVEKEFSKIIREAGNGRFKGTIAGEDYVELYQELLNQYLMEDLPAITADSSDDTGSEVEPQGFFSNIRSRLNGIRQKASSRAAVIVTIAMLHKMKLYLSMELLTVARWNIDPELVYAPGYAYIVKNTFMYSLIVSDSQLAGRAGFDKRNNTSELDANLAVGDFEFQKVIDTSTDTTTVIIDTDYDFKSFIDVGLMGYMVNVMQRAKAYHVIVPYYLHFEV